MPSGTVAIRFVGDIRNLTNSIDSVDRKLGGFKGAMGKVAAAAGGIFAGAKAFDFLSSSIRDAADEQQGIEVLANTMRKTTGATNDQIDATERWITSMQNATGIMDDELRAAMGKLIISGRSVAKAEKDLGVAADIAAARHIDLTTVVQAMSKAALGNVAGLGRLGIATKNAAGETLSYDQILQKASETMGGAAAAAADTAAGKAAILKAKFADLKENIGTALMPIMESLTNALMKLTDWFNKLSPGMQKAVLIGGGLLVALGPMVALIGNIGTAVKGLSAAFSFLAANPIVLAIAAAAALTVALVILYNKSETFRNAVDAMGRVVTSVFKFIKEHVDLLLVSLGPLGLGIIALRHNWETAWSAMSSAVEKAWKIIGPIVDKIGGAIKFISSQLDKIPGVGGGGGDTPKPIAPNFSNLPPPPGLTTTPSAPGRYGAQSVTNNNLVVHANTNDGHELGRILLWKLGRVT